MLDIARRASTSHEICLDLSEYIKTRIPDHLENHAANGKRKQRRGASIGWIQALTWR
jgi:hypothetical protein